MLEAIGAAEHSVRLELYTFTASPLGERFKDALVSACERGVNVRILLDGWGSYGLPQDYWAPLIERGGEFKWFNPLRLEKWGVRNHRKLLVCDEQIAFVGGFNIAPEYEGDGVTQGWKDLGMIVEGAVSSELAASFDMIFEQADVPLRRRRIRQRKGKTGAVSGDSECHLLLGGPGKGFGAIKKSLYRDLASAGSVRIMVGYFLPTLRFRRLLKRLARKGVKVQLLLAGKSDIPISQTAGKFLYRQFLRAGVEIFEYQPQVLHAKMMVIDEHLYVGSCNLDIRSMRINYELLVRIDNRLYAEEANRIFEDSIRHSVKIDPKKWAGDCSFFKRLKQRFAYLLLARLDPYLALGQLKWTK